jgi:hypothetical protein
MILTQCAVCATELGLSLGKKCGRCSTRYCGAACQVQHWKEGGHDTLCKKIKKAGGAEQYNANKRYAEAVTVAVEKCAEDTKGQTCYICMEAVHRRTGEGLVRGCACGDRDGVASGTTGVAHVSCLAEQAKILWAEGEENNLGAKARNERWARWHTCSLCEQNYHGVVRGALGWACWKTYLGRPEADQIHGMAMNQLGRGLYNAAYYEDALSVQEAELAMLRRLGASEDAILVAQGNLANTYGALERLEDALLLKQEVYSARLMLDGQEARETLREANNFASSLNDLERFEEAKALFRKTMPVARRVLGESHHLTLNMMMNYAAALCNDDGATLDDLREAVATFEEIQPTARRTLGGAHPLANQIEYALHETRAALRACETPEDGEVLQTADDLAAHFGGLLGDSKNSYTYSTATVIWHGVSKHVGSDWSSALNV